MSINKLLSKLKFLESQIANHLALIKESIEDVESLKKTIVGEDDFLKPTGSATTIGEIDAIALKEFLKPIGSAVTHRSVFADEIEEQRIQELSEQKIYFICAQPNTKYYAWQLEVMLRNFNEMGILSNPKYEVHIVTNLVPRPNQYPIEVYQIGEVEVISSGVANSHTNLRSFYYNDTRATKHYPSSIRPNLLKQHFAAHPEIKTFFYHDCDMIFTKKDLDFTPFLQDDICYGSDVRFYIGHDYIASKEHNVLEYMCNIAQIPLRVVRDNEHNCIGAQYLIKDVSADFWEEVEKISEELFLKITQRNNYIKAQNPQYHELQIFAADMWAVLWCLWKLGKQTVPHKFFDFAWATDTIERYNECNIYHNAGVTESGHGLFFKGEFQDKVPDKNLRINPLSACSPYYELVKQIMIVK
jgi:hypothetical protein